MFEARVAQFYRAKGYSVHENPKVRGGSENVYSVAMVADGPLGALLISFGDAGGVDAAEVGRVRTMARDVGATPVVAAPDVGPDLRRLAAQMGVVVVDDAMVTDTGPLPQELPAAGAKDPLRRDLDAHPWPASGRAFSYADTATAAARDVDEMVADLHAPRPPPLSPQAAAAGWQALQAVQTVQQPAPVPALVPVPAPPAPAPTPPAAKFAWLGATPATAPVDLSALLARSEATTAVPAIEHEAALRARTPALERAREAGTDLADRVRLWPWKTIAWVSVGAAALVAAIRWLA